MRKIKIAELSLLSGIIFLIVVFAVLPFTTVCYSATSATGPTTATSIKPIKFTVAFFLPLNTSTIQTFKKMYLDKVTQESNGAITFKMLGPEVFNSTEVGTAVQKDSADMGYIFVGAYENLVPGDSCAYLRTNTLAEERKNGAYEYLLQMHKKAGLYYFGCPWPINPTTGFFALYLNKKVATKQDFVGLRIGGTAAARAAVQAWGSTWVSMINSEYYSALQRGVVDGITAVPPSTFRDFHYYEVTKYIVPYRFFDCSLAFIMNLHKFNSLPSNVQNLLTQTFNQSQKELEVIATKNEDSAQKEMIDKGELAPLQLAPDVAKWFVQSAYDATWKYEASHYPGPTGVLKPLLTK